MQEEIRLSVGARLREERERLGFSQGAFGQLAEVSLRTEQDWERGVSSVRADFLSVAFEHGVDVLYVLTGERLSARVSLDPLRRAVLGSFDRCSPEKQIEAVQYMALLAAGVAPGPTGGASASTVTKAKVSKSFLGFAGNVVGKKDV